jgi:hypothetical protein
MRGLRCRTAMGWSGKVEHQPVTRIEALYRKELLARDPAAFDRPRHGCAQP